jgi:hypothetical protein
MIDRMVALARRGLVALRSVAEATQREVHALGAVPSVILGRDRPRDFLGTAQEVRPYLRVAMTLVQYLGNDVRLGFLDMRQPRTDRGFLFLGQG